MSEQSTRTRKLTASELSRLFTNLAMVYSSGLPLSEGFDILLESSTEARMKDLLAKLSELIASGNKLSEAFRFSGGVPDYAMVMLGIAEETGKMADTCISLANFYDKRDRLAATIRSALVYPLALLVMIFIVMVVLLTQAMPIFDQVFAQLGFGLSGLAAALLAASLWLRQAALGIGGAVVALALLFYLASLTTVGKKVFRWCYEHNPITGGLSVRLSVQRLMLALSAMLKSGMTPQAAVGLTEGLIEDNRVRKRLKTMQLNLDEGMSLQDAFKKSGLIPPENQALIALSFKTGLNAEAFEVIGDDIARTTEQQTSALVAAIEPTLIAVMCVLVGVVLLSVMLPLLGFLLSI